MDAPETQAAVRRHTSVTACLRCREQKLKCGRERPVCTRCQRLGAICSYPSPPNRRGPRTHRGARSRAKARATERSREQTCPVIQPGNDTLLPQTPTIEARRPAIVQHMTPFDSNDNQEGNSYRSPTQADGTPAVPATGTPVLSDSYPNQLRTMSPIATEPAPIAEQAPLPPTALGLSLLELYFTRIYNASLMFHKPVLFQQYLEQKLHGVLLRALLALATLFLQPCTSDSEKEATGGHTELKVLGIYHSSGLPWARDALKEAMALIVDSPSLMVIQALQCLQHYWFGIGQPYRGNLCLALAYRACHLLGYNKKIPNGVIGLDVSLESELGRRCFWACWTSTCIVMEPEPYIEASWQEMAMVPLPGLIQSTSSGYTISLGETMDEFWNSSTLSTVPINPTYPGALVKMVGVWAKVQLLCKHKASSPVSERFVSEERLSRLAISIFDDAGPLRELGHQSSWTPENRCLLLVHDALYHRCQISIHSMAVPLFSGIPNDPKIDTVRQRRSAAIVVEHADRFRRLLEPYFCGECHVSFLPPLVGYGAFVVAIVFLAMEISCPIGETSSLAAGASGNGCRISAVKSILQLLDHLRVYWRALQRPWEILHSALQAGFPKHAIQSRPAIPQSCMSSEHALLKQNHSWITNMHSDNLPAQPSDRENLDTSARYGQTSEASNGQLQTFEAMPPEEESEAQRNFHLANADNNGFEVAAEGAANDPSMCQINVPPDDDWYSLSFAEAGVEQFVGLEPYSLFQQGWGTIG